jgi:hypothetical protein
MRPSDSVELKQTDFGIEPVSAALGTVKVKDEESEAVREPPPSSTAIHRVLRGSAFRSDLGPRLGSGVVDSSLNEPARLLSRSRTS